MRTPVQQQRLLTTQGVKVGESEGEEENVVMDGKGLNVMHLLRSDGWEGVECHASSPGRRMQR